jgi:hypothetical protein
MLPCALMVETYSSCGPAWIRTKDQGIHVTEAFPPRVDYLFTREYPV